MYDAEKEKRQREINLKEMKPQILRVLLDLKRLKELIVPAIAGQKTSELFRCVDSAVSNMDYAWQIVDCAEIY